VSRRTVLVPLFALPAVLAALAAPAAAQSTPTATSPPTGASGLSGPQPMAESGGKSTPQPKITMQLKGAANHKLEVGNRLRAVGRITPFVPHQRVDIRIGRDGHTVKERKFRVTQIRHTGVGRFHLESRRLIHPGPYLVTAVHRTTANEGYARRLSQKVSITYPDLDPGDSSDTVGIFTHLLAHRGYYTPTGDSYNSRVGLAVLAYRKVNGMARTTNATPSMFRTLAKYQGGFKLKYPDGGRHVEVDISRQVMALANNGKAHHIFHVSTGAPATPTITGHFSVYSKRPGRLSDGMYYSSFFHGGYAIHGYPSVPTYNASHGCVRVPETFAIFIYNWLPIGTSVYTYH
jgi:lipoprotein-anchoring transpeptidase ErfK/SrfK